MREFLCRSERASRDSVKKIHYRDTPDATRFGWHRVVQEGQSVRLTYVVVASLALALGCGDDDRPPSRDGGGGGSDGGGMEDGGPIPTVCTPGQYACSGNTRYLCGDDGRTRLNEEVCAAACSPTLGCVACMPGQRSCDGTNSMICATDGSRFVTSRDCAENSATCGPSGYCTDDCAAAESTLSNIGCEYWPAPLPNLSNIRMNGYDFRVVVANPNSQPANVRVFRGDTMVSSTMVAANGLEAIVLPWVDSLTFSISGAPWQSLTVANGSYRLLSDRPVTVAQFNPFEYSRSGGDPSYTNDASLLLPAHSLTGNYIASSFVPLSAADPGFIFLPDTYSKYPGYIAITGITREPTQVSIALSAPVAADAGGRFPATPRGGTISFMLQRGEVAVVAAAPPPDCTSSRPGRRSDDTGRFFCNEAEHDLTGSRISSNHPIVVFGGHVCAYVPYSAQACDHLENQMPPLETWGSSFVSGPLRDTGSSAPNLLRVTAAFDGTEVTVDPPQGGTSSFTLSAGQWREVEITSPYRVNANRAIMATQYLVGQYATTPAASRGDPAMVVLPPSEQFRRDYTFVAPTSYNSGTQGQNFVLVVRPTGVPVMLDGGAVSTTWTTVGDREVGILPIEGGTRRMESTEPFGVIVYGMGQFTSYAYPAGLNLEEILLI